MDGIIHLRVPLIETSMEPEDRGQSRSKTRPNVDRIVVCCRILISVKAPSMSRVHPLVQIDNSCRLWTSSSRSGEVRVSREIAEVVGFDGWLQGCESRTVLRGTGNGGTEESHLALHSTLILTRRIRTGHTHGVRRLHDLRIGMGKFRFPLHPCWLPTFLPHVLLFYSLIVSLIFS